MMQEDRLKLYLLRLP